MYRGKVEHVTKILTTALVVVHLVATLWHGDAHAQLGIDLPPEKNLFVYTVILLAPLVAAVLVWTRHVSLGLWVFVLSMLGSLLFGAYHHYVLVSPDNIAHLPSGSPAHHVQFISSAATIALLELASALWGAFCLGVHRT
jgi:hypothetical protein